jgi:membrane protease YdiL (CAAX protease family)
MICRCAWRAETSPRGGNQPAAGISTAAQWARLLAGLLSIFALFQWLATLLGSNLGETGLVVAGAMTAATLGVERLLFTSNLRAATRALGVGRPRQAGLIVAGATSVLLLSAIPLFAVAPATSIALAPDWFRYVPGIFAQGGLAEETLFRAYLFGHLRATRSFWRAASLSLLPFAAVHVLLFFTMPWPVAVAALLLAMATSIPLAHLFELGGNTIWAPALVHAVIQGAPKRW